MSKEAMKLAQKWQQTDWNTESPMSADFAVSEAHDVINALIDALREALAEQPAQRTWVGLEKSDMPDGADPLFDDPKFIAGMVYAANKLMEKNT